MEKILGLVIDYSKEHGISATVPVFMYIVFRAAKEDLTERINGTKDVASKNHDDIEALEIKVASLQATVEALKEVVY